MLEMRLYMAQRISALVIAPLTLGHVALMIYAVQGGLTAAEILGRTGGSLGWAVYYAVFVLAVAVHAAIGLRTVISETFGLSGRGRDLVAIAIGLALLALGFRAVYAVTAI